MDNKDSHTNPSFISESGDVGASAALQGSMDTPKENVQKVPLDDQTKAPEVIGQAAPPYTYSQQPPLNAPGTIGQPAPPYGYTQYPPSNNPGVVGQPAPPYAYAQQPPLDGQNQVPGVIGQPGTGYVYAQQAPNAPGVIGQPGTSYVYTQQPQTNNMIVVAQEQVPDHYTLSWFVCLCCCCPIGLCAISKANEARRLVREGRFPEARAVSENARKYCIIGIVVGIVISVVIAIWRIIMAVSGVY